MSEHQIVVFRAIDRPVSDENFRYMQRQSSRAEITPWSFENEYHYGDFRGNALEMLRRGYDLHLHYANFGIRKLAIRLPLGLPDPAAAKNYAVKGGLKVVKDKQGPGLCLVVEPYDEMGDLPYVEDDLSDWADGLLPLRAEIIGGDLRPLYLAHLAAATDDNHDPEETTEAPVPAGLGELTEAQQELAQFYGLDEKLLAAAATESGPLPKAIALEDRYEKWVSRQSASLKNGWLAAWMKDPNSAARAELLSNFRKENETPTWPTTRPNRTIAELLAAAEKLPARPKKPAKAGTSPAKSKPTRK